jgi:hypothetical protein
MGDIYAAAAECVRLECLSQEADNHARRLRLEYHAAMLRLRDLALAAGESEPAETAERDLFTGAEG